MAVITFASAKGAPGVSTTTLALAATWPRSVVVVEADTAGASFIPGFLQGRIDGARGLQQVAIAASQHRLADGFWTQALRPFQGDETRAVVPGLLSPGAAPALRDLWAPLGTFLSSLDAGGVDVLVDLGRLGTVPEPRDALIRLADLAVIVSDSTVPQVVATRELVAHRRAAVVDRDGTHHVHLSIGQGQPFKHDVAASSIGLPTVGHLAHDPDTARLLSHGTDKEISHDSQLMRSAHVVAHTIRNLAIQRRNGELVELVPGRPRRDLEVAS